MTEKVLSGKKNGMAVLLLTILGYLAAIVFLIFGGSRGIIPLFVLGLIWICLGWILLLGLKVLKPKEALVLTLFGKYIGTLKEEGFYFVNPFCTAVNPAAKTKLSQSGDVDGGHSNALLSAALTKNAGDANIELTSKKISLKAMTLSNSRQKINDCLGNPIEIG
ncbi:MAG: SPFH domain-containing protein, partial [Oscillospiraceae bacterium]|nr:SPFH domain-containing protein [Oscillospiraceae bacterium]